MTSLSQTLLLDALNQLQLLGGPQGSAATYKQHHTTAFNPLKITQPCCPGTAPPANSPTGERGVGVEVETQRQYEMDLSAHYRKLFVIFGVTGVGAFIADRVSKNMQ